MQQTQDKLCKSVSEEEEQQTNNWMLQKIASGCFWSVRRQTIANVSECNANSEKWFFERKKADNIEVLHNSLFFM